VAESLLTAFTPVTALATAPTAPTIRLPTELLAVIGSFLDPESLISFSEVGGNYYRAAYIVARELRWRHAAPDLGATPSLVDLLLDTRKIIDQWGFTSIQRRLVTTKQLHSLYDLPAQQEYTYQGLKYREEWRSEGKLHRAGGPAEIVYFRYATTPESVVHKESWYHHGVVHRDDGPAITTYLGGPTNGPDTRMWYKHGVWTGIACVYDEW